MHVVYILVSQKDATKYYIGSTQDLAKRLKAHNNAQSGYTKRYAPWRVEAYITFENRNIAYNFEKYLKVGSGNAFLKKRLI